MKETIFTGAAVALVTPFNPDMSVNYEELEKLIEFQITSGTDAIVTCGTTGEAATLTDEEHVKVIEFTVNKVAGRVPVIAGTGSNCTETAIYLSQEAEKYGAGALPKSRSTRRKRPSACHAVLQQDFPARPRCKLQPHCGQCKNSVHCV